jgi:hypothetical protein
MYEHLAKLAEKIGNEIHDEATDPQEDCSELAGEKIADAIRAAEPQWQTTPPTVEGFYWAKFEDGKRTVVEVHREYDGMRFTEIGSDEDVRLDRPWIPTHWLGPLPIPEQPKGE